jgi:hypothetical protein
MIPELGKLYLVRRVESKFWLELYDNPNLEASTPEHNSSLNTGILRYERL